MVKMKTPQLIACIPNFCEFQIELLNQKLNVLNDLIVEFKLYSFEFNLYFVRMINNCTFLWIETSNS